MDGSISVSADQRKRLLQLFRSGNDVRVSRRAQIILLLADGCFYRDVHAYAYASFDFIAETVRRFQSGSVEGLAERSRSDEEPAWLEQVLTWLVDKTPEDFGYFRSR